jgi:long-chain acyl-CoA synthetase
MKKGIEISTKNGKRIVEGLGYYEPIVVKDLRELIKGSAARYGTKTAFQFKDKEGRITSRTYLEFDSDIDCLGTALVSLGLKGSHIAIIGENRYEWAVSYFSIINGTGVAVPLDKYLPKNEVINLIERGKVAAIFYSPSYQEMMEDLSQTNDNIKYYICMEELKGSVKGKGSFTSMPELIKKGRELISSGDRSFLDADIDRNSLSVLLFTSGTTSMAKGVMLSHSNIASNVVSISTVIRIMPNDVHLSLLPLHHTFENTVGLSFMVHSGVCIAYSDGIRHVAKNLREYNVTLLIAVPAIFEAMYRKIQDGIKKSGKKKAFDMMVKISDALRAVGIDIRRTLFKSIYNQLGAQLRLAVSGAAPLDPEVVVGFDKIGFKLLQGYGLTEASPVVSTNNDFVNKTGTIGLPIMGVEVTLDSPDEDGMGEILVRGDNVMLGYYEDPEATAEAIDKDGWFRTGDLGIIDKDGFIKITGRAKSMIVFTNGKKAFPEEYEVMLNNLQGVKDSFVWGNKAPDGDIQVCAKLVLDKEKLEKEDGSLPSEEELANRFNDAIKEINATIPQYKIIRYFVMTWEDLIKTTTLKVKRPIETEKIRNTLDRAGLDMRKASGRFIDNL